MKKQWQQAFGKMTYGIYVLTCRHGEHINGMIVSWAVQVSHDPPLILVAVHPNRYTHNLMKNSASFALHILEKSQADFLKRFKGPAPDEKFAGLDWKEKKTGTPILDDCLAWFELEKIQTLSPGNHILYIGKVINAGYNDHPGVPLCTLDYKGMYTGEK